MIPGLQTHFGARIPLDELAYIYSKGIRLARIDAQTCSHETMLELFGDCHTCDLAPLVIVGAQDYTRLAMLPAGTMVEWTNEPDGDISPRAYRADLNTACQMAERQGVELWAPAISNLDEDSLMWLNKVRDWGGGWPEGLAGISAHSYGPFPHKGFSSREREVYWLKAACGDLPFMITEMGLASEGGVSEQEQADFAREEWQFWTDQGAVAAVWFQIHDGPTETREHRYGWRRCAADGTLLGWKPVSESVPR